MLIQADLEEVVVGEHQDLFVVEQVMLEDILHQKEIQVEQEYLHLLIMEEVEAEQEQQEIQQLQQLQVLAVMEVQQVFQEVQ
jgi:hypothetical protein